MNKRRNIKEFIARWKSEAERLQDAYLAAEETFLSKRDAASERVAKGAVEAHLKHLACEGIEPPGVTACQSSGR